MLELNKIIMLYPILIPYIFTDALINKYVNLVVNDKTKDLKFGPLINYFLFIVCSNRSAIIKVG